MEKKPIPSVLKYNQWVNKLEFNIYNVDRLYHLALAEHITFQTGLQNNYMNNYI